MFILCFKYPMVSNLILYYITVYFHGSTAVVGKGLLITDVSRSHSVGFLPTSHKDLYMATHNTNKRQTFTPRRDSDPQSQ